MKNEVINCTPHEITLQVEVDGKQECIVFEPSGVIPRVNVRTIEDQTAPICGIPTVKQEFWDISGLPEEIPGIYLIVSGVVFAASDRKDLIAPNTSTGVIRNDKGQIIAVTSFLRK